VLTLHPAGVCPLWSKTLPNRSEERGKQYKQTVVHFAQLLDSVAGLQVEVDLFHYDANDVDFTRWGARMVDWADSVVMIASNALWERWSGRNPPTEGAGAARECDALHGLFDKDQADFQRKVVIAILPGETDENIPNDLSRVQHRTVPQLTMDGLELLLRRLLDQPRYPRPAEKTAPHLPPYTVPPIVDPSSDPTND
jgi:hypothetical protein